MGKQIRLNAFDMNCIVHQSPGLWTHPLDRADTYNTLQYWTDLAQILERGKFDALFLADVLGIYDVYRGSPDAALEGAVQVPVNDPLMTIPAMAMVTRNLGFGVTCTLSYEHPYPFARRISTLDHLTQGRIGWNIVTGYLNSAAKGMGMPQQTGHDTRYDIADDYMEVCYKLWEGSWEDGAVLRERASGRFADPSRIHRIEHDGPYFRLSAIHLCEPSPATHPGPVTRPAHPRRGRQFAARHAECVFINGPSKQVIAPDRGRPAPADQGSRPRPVGTDHLRDDDRGDRHHHRRAHDKLAEYRRYASEQGGLVLMSGWTGVDFSRLDPDEIVRFDRKDAQTSALEAFTTADPNRTWTVRQIAAHTAIGGRSPLVVGSARRGGRGTDRLGGRDRRGRLQPRLRHHARHVHRHGRPRGARVAEP